MASPPAGPPSPRGRSPVPARHRPPAGPPTLTGPGDSLAVALRAARRPPGAGPSTGTAPSTGNAPPRRRLPTGPLSIVLVLVGIFATGAGLGHSANWPWQLLGGDRPPPREFPVLEPSRPIRITIDAIDVRAPVSRVGLADDGSIAVPPVDRHNEVGWYDLGPTPGEFGPAILVGHADTRTGPSVFHGLPGLRPGSRVEITREDRSVAIFEVNSIEHFDKRALPAERVYGDYHRPGLRLITCGGQWVGGGTGYADNIIAFASLVGSRQP